MSSTKSFIQQTSVSLSTSMQMISGMYQALCSFSHPLLLVASLVLCVIGEVVYNEGVHFSFNAFSSLLAFRSMLIGLFIVSAFLLLPLLKLLLDYLSKSYQRRIRIVHMEGNIAAGKSTTCEELKTELVKNKHCLALSSVRGRTEFMPASLLTAFKKDPAGKTLAVQNFGIWHRTASYYQELHESFKAVQQTPFGGPAFVLMDRGLLGDSLFLICNRMLGNCCDEDYTIYSDAVKHFSIRDAFWAPGQATVFFNVSLRRCIQNLRGRGTVDSDTDNSYLRAVHYTHLYGILWLMSCPACSDCAYIANRGPVLPVTPVGDEYPSREEVSNLILKSGDVYDAKQQEHTHEKDFSEEMLQETVDIPTRLHSLRAHDEESLRQLVAHHFCARHWVKTHATERSVIKIIFDALDHLWLSS